MPPIGGETGAGICPLILRLGRAIAAACHAQVWLGGRLRGRMLPLLLVSGACRGRNALLPFLRLRLRIFTTTTSTGAQKNTGQFKRLLRNTSRRRRGFVRIAFLQGTSLMNYKKIRHYERRHVLNIMNHPYTSKLLINSLRSGNDRGESIACITILSPTVLNHLFHVSELRCLRNLRHPTGQQHLEFVLICRQSTRRGEVPCHKNEPSLASTTLPL
jgi:hypothetical protein